MESLVSLLTSKADSIARRSAVIIKVMTSVMTEDFANTMHGVSHRLGVIHNRVQLIYTADCAKKSAESRDPSTIVSSFEDSARASTPTLKGEDGGSYVDGNGDGQGDGNNNNDNNGDNNGDKGHGNDSKIGCEEEAVVMGGDEIGHELGRLTISNDESMMSPQKSKKVICAGDTDLFRSEVDASYSRQDIDPTVDEAGNIPEEQLQASEFDFSVLDREGEFDLDTLPPLLSTVSKAEILRSCTAAELTKSAMTRWKTVALVLTESKMYIHNVDDEKVASLKDISNCDEVYRLILGDPPANSFRVSDINATVLLHPVFSDAFEVAIRSSSEKLIFLTKGTVSTTEWLDALAPLSPSQDSAVMFSSTEI